MEAAEQDRSPPRALQEIAMTAIHDLLVRTAGLHKAIADDVPQIKRGQVWCTVCGRSQKVDGAECLRSGWPKCHGYTMTIDSPEERASRKAQP